MIRNESDLRVAGEAEDVPSALAAIQALRPDLVVADLSLPGRNGLELLKDMAVQHPGVPTLVLSMHDESLYAERAIRAGARGYLMKSAGGRAVLDAIRAILAGRIHVSPAVATRVLESLGRSGTASRSTSSAAHSKVQALSDREFEVFQLIGQGLGTREIAGRLGIDIDDGLDLWKQRGFLLDDLKCCSDCQCAVEPEQDHQLNQHAEVSEYAVAAETHS